MPLLTLILLLLPGVAFGQNDFVPLVGIPYVDTTAENTTLGDYVNGLYWASISIAAVLAFLKITWAGIKYMLSEVVTDKASAKKDIWGALLGLIIILAAVLMLDTVNPELSNLNALNLVDIGGDVTPDDTRTECQKDQNSAECCLERDGNYVQENNNSYCLNPVVQGEDMFSCEAKPNMVWDSETEECREDSGFVYFDINDVEFDENNIYEIPLELWQSESVDKGLLFNHLSTKCLILGGSDVTFDQGTEKVVYTCEGIPSDEELNTVYLGRYTCATVGEPNCTIDGVCDYSSQTVDCTAAINECTADGGTRYTESAAIVECYQYNP